MIDKSSFELWMKDPVTQALMVLLKEIKKNLETDMLSDSVIMHTDGSKLLARACGLREGLDLILGVKIEDLEESDEKTDTSGT